MHSRKMLVVVLVLALLAGAALGATTHATDAAFLHGLGMFTASIVVLATVATLFVATIAIRKRSQPRERPACRLR